MGPERSGSLAFWRLRKVHDADDALPFADGSGHFFGVADFFLGAYVTVGAVQVDVITEDRDRGAQFMNGAREDKGFFSTPFASLVAYEGGTRPRARIVERV